MFGARGAWSASRRLWVCLHLCAVLCVCLLERAAAGWDCVNTYANHIGTGDVRSAHLNLVRCGFPLAARVLPDWFGSLTNLASVALSLARCRSVFSLCLAQTFERSMAKCLQFRWCVNAPSSSFLRRVRVSRRVHMMGICLCHLQLGIPMRLQNFLQHQQPQWWNVGVKSASSCIISHSV